MCCNFIRDGRCRGRSRGGIELLLWESGLLVQHLDITTVVQSIIDIQIIVVQFLTSGLDVRYKNAKFFNTSLQDLPDIPKKCGLSLATTLGLNHISFVLCFNQ